MRFSGGTQWHGSTGTVDPIPPLYIVTTVDPTIIDDASDGYAVGKRWINTVTGATWTLVDNTIGGAIWSEEDNAGGGGGGSSLGGDLGGTTAAGYVKIVRGLSTTVTYDGSNRVSTITTSLGTKTMTYNGDGTLASITGSGNYHNKSFTYSGGILQSITVS